MSKVKTFLEVAGVTGTPEDIQLYKHLLVEEGSEFLKAWVEDDEVEMMDGLCDTSFILQALSEFGLQFTLNPSIVNAFDYMTTFSPKQFRQGFEIVCDSNLSKFDKTWKEAFKTQQYYIKEFGVIAMIKYNEKHDLYSVKVEFDQYCVDGKFWPKDKLLKSVTHYFAPDFSEVLK